jgi:hypothetical protein
MDLESIAIIPSNCSMAFLQIPPSNQAFEHNECQAATLASSAIKLFKLYRCQNLSGFAAPYTATWPSTPLSNELPTSFVEDST